MSFKYLHLAVSVTSLVVSLVACNTTTGTPDPPVYDPTPFTFELYGNASPPYIAADNPLTIQGVELGRMLFNEKALSAGSRQSCADCHVQRSGFSDPRTLSIGVDGLPGRRQAMPIFNTGYQPDILGPGFFWDGRAATLREQALRPIQDPMEMHETLDNVVTKLTSMEKYRSQFVRAFNTQTITPEYIGLALEQFEHSLLSNNSKYDRAQRMETTLTDREERGKKLFFSEMSADGVQRGAECFHCHGGSNFTNYKFMNNGLDNNAAFQDSGRYEVTKTLKDLATFKTPSLRNIAVTAPYMHDGRFKTLVEVIAHYNHEVKQSTTVNSALFLNLRTGGLGLRDDEVADLEAFLHTLTDSTFLGLK